MTQSKCWVFTHNNPTATDSEFLENARSSWSALTYLIFQREQGENGTIHFQGYCEFSCAKRLTTLKRLDPTAHWETRRGTQSQAIAYASKEDTRVSGPLEYGTRLQTHQGERTDLSAAVLTLQEGGIKRVREECPVQFVKYSRGLRDLDLGTIRQTGTAPEVTLLFGPPGCGKTSFFYTTEGDQGVSLASSNGYWFDGYEGEEAVLLDDFDGRASKWPLSSTLRVLDRYAIRVPVKGSFTRWNPRRIYVTTNIHPRDWYEWGNREQQYPALIRRFTRVLWWKRMDTLLDLSSESEEWIHFWKGPQAKMVLLNNPMGVHAQSVDYFSFE